jgi:hypothetical protein
MHVGGWDEENYDDGVTVGRGEKPNLCWDRFGAGYKASYIWP